MSTVSTQVERDIAGEWDSNSGYASAVFAGIVGDLIHALQGGYHISIMDQPKTNYSVTRPDDKAPPGNWPRDTAAAIDMSMSTADMIKCWNRVYAVWANRANDPRAKYFNAFNGWNGIGQAERLDFVAGTRTVATPDHKSHCHDELRRRYVNDSQAKKAHLSVFRGETIEQYLGEADMTIEWNEVTAVLNGTTIDGYASATAPTWARDQMKYNNREVEDRTKARDALMMGKLDELLGRPAVVLSDANVASIAETLAAALVDHEGNALTPEDLGNIKEVVDGYFRSKFSQTT